MNLYSLIVQEGLQTNEKIEKRQACWKNKAEGDQLLEEPAEKWTESARFDHSGSFYCSRALRRSDSW